MALTKVTYSMINGACVNVLDVGIIPNDNSKRAANTVALLSALNTSEVYCIEFPPNYDTYYFDSFTIPQKVITIRGFCTLRADSGAIIDIAEDPITNVCIDTADGPQLSRFSSLQGLIINASISGIGVRIRNGGLMMDNVFIQNANIGINILESYGASYTNIGASGKTAGIKIGDGVGGGYVSINNFTNLALNNTPGSTNPGGGTTNGKGFWAGAGNFANNTIQGMDCSWCGWGVYLDYHSSFNNFVNYWAENNIQKNIEYTLRPAVTQADFWINSYYGEGTYIPSGDVFPTNGTNPNQAHMQLRLDEFTVRSINPMWINFPVVPTPYGNPYSLDSYQEGVWVPVPNRDSGGMTGVYSDQVGIFTKIGRLVFLYGKFTIVSISSPSASFNLIQGVPFPAETNPDTGWASGGGGVVLISSALTSQVKGCRMYFSNGLYLVDMTGADISENWVAGGTIEFTATYMATN